MRKKCERCSNLTIVTPERRQWLWLFRYYNPAYIYLFKVNNRNTRKTVKKVTVRRLSGVFDIKFQHIAHPFPVSSLLTVSKYLFAVNQHLLKSNLLLAKDNNKISGTCNFVLNFSKIFWPKTILMIAISATR